MPNSGQNRTYDANNSLRGNLRNPHYDALISRFSYFLSISTFCTALSPEPIARRMEWQRGLRHPQLRFSHARIHSLAPPAPLPRSLLMYTARPFSLSYIYDTKLPTPLSYFTFLVGGTSEITCWGCRLSFILSLFEMTVTFLQPNSGSLCLLFDSSTSTRLPYSFSRLLLSHSRHFSTLSLPVFLKTAYHILLAW